MDPDVINFDDLPNETPKPKVAAPQGLPDAIGFDDLPDEGAAPAASQPQLPGASLGTFGDSVGRSYNEFYAKQGISDRVRIEAMLRELDAGGNPDINPIKTWGDGIKMDLGRAFGANVEAPQFKRQYLLKRLGEIDEEIKSSGAAVTASGQGSQQLSDLQAGLQEAQKQDSFLSKTGSAFSALYNNPAGIPELIGGGAYTMGRPIVAGIGAAALSKGRTLVPMVTSAAVSGADSYDGTMAEIIEQKGREGGIDVRKNPEAIPTLLQDEGFIEAARAEALRRGISDAAWSAISMRLGMSPKIKGVWQPVVQSAAEVGTEASGQLVQKGKVYDPTALPVSGVTGLVFEGPGYALGRAAGAFGKPDAPAAPAAPQAEQTPPPAPVAPATPDVILFDDLPSVAGETVEPVAAEPAPVPATPAPAPVQPEAAAQPAPVAEPAAVPAAPVRPDPNTTTAADMWKWVDENRAWQEKYGKTHNADGTPKGAAPAPVEPVAQPQPEPAPAQPQAATPVATQPVEPRPKTPAQDAPQSEWDAYWPVSKEWDAKYAKTHWGNGTPKRAEMIEGTPEFAAFQARVREAAARREAEQQAQAAAAAQPAAPAPVATQPEATPAPTPQPVATTQPDNEPSVSDSIKVANARDRLSKLEAAGKGDSKQAKSLRRTIERETQAAKPPTTELPPIRPRKTRAEYIAELDFLFANKQIDEDSYWDLRGQLEGLEDAPGVDRRDSPPAAQTEIAGTEDTFNLTGEQVAAPTTRAEDTTAEMPLEGATESAIATEARSRLAKLEAAGKGDSGQAQALRRTIERETKPAQPAVEQKPKGMTVEIMGKKYPVASMQEASAKWLSATKQIEDSGVSLNRDTGLQENLWSGDGPVVRDADGKIIGYIAQNGSIKKNRNVVAEGNDLYVPTDADYDAAGYPRQEQATKPSGEEPAEVKAARKVIENPKSIDELNNAWDTVFKYEKKGKYAVEAKPDQPQIAQPNPRTDAENTAPQSTQAKPAPAAEAATDEQPKAPEPAAEQPKQEAKPRERKPDPKTGEPYEVTLARRRVDNPKTNPYRYTQAVRILDQYENDQKLAKYDPTVDLDKVSDEAMTEFLDAHAQRDDATKTENDYADGVNRAAERRFGPGSEQFGDLLADMRNLAKRGVALPVLPDWFKRESGRTFASIIGRKIPGALKYPPLLQADEKRAKTDGEYRNDIYRQFEGMVESYAQSLADLGWTQVDPSNNSAFDAVQELVSQATNGERLVPEGGVGGVAAKASNPRAYSTDTQSADPDIIRDLEEEADTREPEPSEEDKQAALGMEVEYEDPRFDAQPDPFTETLLAEAEAQGVSEQSILEMLDKAAAERLDPRNRNSLGPDLIAALVWQTARDIQKGVVSFAKWSADMAKKFPTMKGSLKAIWAKAQDVAKRPMDYIRFRALDSIADKVWQNVRRNKGSATLRKIANIVFAKAGPDADATENDIPTRINLVRNQFSNIYANIMERFAREFADMTPEQRRKWDEDFRAAVIDGTTPSDPKVAQAVKDFRNLMRDMLEYQRNAGIEMGDQGASYFPRNYDADAVEADRDGFIAAAQEMYRKREERLLNKAIKDVRKAEKDRPAERRAADRKFGRKEKTDAEYRQEAAEWAQEKIDALEAEFDAKDDDFYKQKAEDWATAITHGDVLGLTLFKTTDGKVTSDSTDARTFTNDEAKLADAFLKKNIDDLMLGYIDGAVRGAEVGRVFGQDGSKFEQMMNQLSREGVDKDTVKETRRLVQKALGVGREQQSQATAAFFDWVNVVLAGAFLGKTFMYNLVLEPISFGIRTGNAYLALKAMADTWRYTIAEISKPSAATRQRLEAKYGSQAAFSKAVTETVAEQVGLIQNEMERAYFNAHWDYSSDEKGSKLAKWISQRIYRANLMSATEKAKVSASIGIARLALRDNARFFTGDAPIQKLFGALGFDTRADKSAAVILRENGVPDADHKAFAAWVAGLEGKTDAEWQKAVMDPKDPMAKHYRRALQRISLGMSIKTNPSLKMEMSDSVLGRMMMQLMNYSYAYSNLVKDRMYSMAAKTVAKDASKIDRLRYAAPLLVGAPLAILGAAASQALIAAVWPSDDEKKRSKETPMVRKAFNWASFAGMFGPKVEYLFKSFERGQAPGGPVGETIFRGGQAVFAAAGDPESDKKMFNARKQLYNSTVKPLVTGAGAAVHPFFGFLGNAAVNTQDVRETFTGEPPRK